MIRAPRGARFQFKSTAAHDTDEHAPLHPFDDEIKADHQAEYQNCQRTFFA